MQDFQHQIAEMIVGHSPALPTLLTERQAAELLNFSPRTLERWRQDGTGPTFVKIGGSIRYRPQDLQQYVAGAASSGSAGE